MLNDKRPLLAAVAFGALLVASGPVMGQQAAQPAVPVADLLRMPPRLDYRAVCARPDVEPLSRDWSDWDGSDTAIVPEQMLADAERYVEGGGSVARNKPLARAMLERLAGTNNLSAAQAKRRLALLLVDPEAGAVDLPRAASLLKEAVAARANGAALSLGRLYRDGILPSADADEPMRLLTLAASLGDARAALELAEAYREPGRTLPFPEAPGHFATLAMISAQTAIVAGDCAMVTDVGDFYLGEGTAAGTAAAAAWFAVGDGIDLAPSELKLARLHLSGQADAPNEGRGLELLDEAATHGSVEAQTAMGRTLLTGGRDMDRALELLERARVDRDMGAYLLLARHHRGDFTGKADMARMAAILQEANELPAVSVSLQADLAFAYLRGMGQDRDEAKARAAVERLETVGTPEAQVAAGRYLVEAGGDLGRAKDLFKEAAAAGDGSAWAELSDLARCDATGDIGEAVVWDEKAAAAGITESLRRQARRLSETGDLAGARSHWERAADLGDRIAMIEIAVIENGLGTPQGQAAAQDWMERATKAGDGIVTGRLALAQAISGGDLPGGADMAFALLEGVSEGIDPGVDLELGRIGLGSPKRDVAIERLRLAAGRGSAEAMMALAQAMEVAEPEAGRDWLRQAAAHGNATALARFATGGATGAGIAAALEGRLVCDPLAQYYVVSLRIGGDVGLETIAPALDHAERLANERAADAFRLGRALIAGTKTLAPDLPRAERLLSLASDRGHLRAGVQLAGVWLRTEPQARRDQALGLLRTAALQGDEQAVEELLATINLHVADTVLRAGALGVLKDAAAAGNAQAMLGLGSVLAMADAEHREEGMGFIRQAAETGSVPAMKALSRLYASGLAGQASADESTRWIRAAAEKGDAEAMFQLALALDLGFGVTADHAAATDWHKKARENGYVD